MGSVVYAPYWLALEMLKKAEVVAGEEKVYIYLDHRTQVGGHFIKSKSINVSKSVEDSS